jgi:hypothetical protein
VIVCMVWLLESWDLNSTHIHGTHVPVEEPSTASEADIRRRHIKVGGRPRSTCSLVMKAATSLTRGKRAAEGPACRLHRARRRLRFAGRGESTPRRESDRTQA